MSTPTNVGNTSMEEVPGARYIYKRGEAAMLTRPYMGDASTLATWLSTQAIGVTTDYEVPDFVLDSVEGIENGAVAEGKQTFYGDPLGTPFFPSDPNNPNVLSKVTWEPRSAILGTTQTADGLFVVNYLSPIITYRYCTSFIFNTPQFYNINNVSIPQTVTIMDFAAAAGNPNAATVNYALTGTWNFQIYAICTAFSRDQRASVYNYMETYAVILQNPTGNPPKQLGTTSATLPTVQ